MLLPRVLEEMVLDFVPVTDLYTWPYLDPSYFHRRWHRLLKHNNCTFMDALPRTWKEHKNEVSVLAKRLSVDKTISPSIKPDVYLLSLIILPRMHMTAFDFEMSLFTDTTGRRVMFNHIHAPDICSLLWGFRETDNTHRLIFKRTNGTNNRILLNYLKFLVTTNNLDEGARIMSQYVAPHPQLTLLAFRQDVLQPLHQALANAYPINRVNELITRDNPTNNPPNDYENYIYLSSRHNDLAKRYFQSLPTISATAVWVLIERQEPVDYIEHIMTKILQTPQTHIVYSRALIHITKIGSYDHMALLVRAGANVNYVETKTISFQDVNSLKGYRTEIGDTPLHVAVTHERHEMIKLLIAEGVDPLVVNHKGINAIQHAKNWRCMKLAAYLEAVVRSRA